MVCCSVCEKESKTLNGIQVWGTTKLPLCSACKSAYYRYCTELFEYLLDHKERDAGIEYKERIWNYLNDSIKCQRKTNFDKSKMCTRAAPGCKLCRKRLTVLTLKSFPRLSKLTKSEGSKQL